MRKSQLKGFLLTLLFGPIGLFYSNVPLALVFLVLAVIVGAVSLGSAMLSWPLSIVVGVFTVKLISKAEWPYEELEELCDGLQLMTAGAVETINDWAFDKAGAPLIEVGSTVFIDIELAEEIASLQTQEPLP
jgi:hypothetical protein